MNRTNRDNPSRGARHLAGASGYSLVEILVVIAIIGVLSAVTIPMMGTLLASFRSSGDIRSVSNAISVAKIRAASAFSRTRVYVDLGARTFHSEVWDSTTSTWTTETGSTSLSSGVTFSYGPVTTPPPNSQGIIGQAPQCTDNLGAAIAGTACIMFNSRGIPIDAASFASTALDAIYVTDGTAVYGATVAATGMTRVWRTAPLATPAWVRN